TPELIMATGLRLGQVAVDGDDLYWIEGRPLEAGRQVIARRGADGRIVDVTPAPFNARTRVHEYGGGAFAVADGEVYFSNFADQQLYRQSIEGETHPITSEGELRYADAVIDRRSDRLICIRECNKGRGNELVNEMISGRLDGRGDSLVLASKHDFYSSPRLSPDGSQLAYLSWNHPNMPWDGTELWVADIGDDGGLDSERTLVAGSADESIFQPEWSPDGILHFVSDRTGWWNLYRWRNGKVEALCPMEAEFGMPQWVFGMSTYGFESTN